MWAFAMLLLASTVQNPPEQTACPGYTPMSIDDVSFSPSSLKPSRTTTVEIEGENESDDTISLVGMTLYLQDDGLGLQDQFVLDNVLDVVPGQKYELKGQWTPAIENWANGKATLYVYLGDTENDLVGCTLTSVNISAMALGLAAALLSLNS